MALGRVRLRRTTLNGSRKAMSLLDETAAGVYHITVTPFADDGALDLPASTRVRFLLEQRRDRAHRARHDGRGAQAHGGGIG